MKSFTFALAAGLSALTCLSCARTTGDTATSLPATPVPYSAADYIQDGKRGTTQARIYRIALSGPGREHVRAALRELDGLFLPAITPGARQIPRAEVQARLERALTHGRALVALEDQSPCAREFLGMLYYRQARFDLARKEFQAAAQLNPGDAYLARAFQRWLEWTEARGPLLHDGFARQMFPGYELYLMEHRLRARAEGIYENHHVYVEGLRFGATPARNLIFELMEHDDPPLTAIVLGSSRVREGARPAWIREELRASSAATSESGVPGGVLNLSYGGASTTFFLGALRYLERLTERKGRKLPFLVLGVDLEMMSFQGIAFLNPPFKPPLTLGRDAWSRFLAGGGNLEVWPYWRFSSRPKPWRAIPWSRLRRVPRRYAFPAQPLNYTINPKLRAEIEPVLQLLGKVAKRPVVIENPVPTFYNEKWSAKSSRPIMRELCARYKLPFVVRSLEEWGLNDGHFYGSVIQDTDKFDYLHLNYPGSHIWSRAIGKILRGL